MKKSTDKKPRHTFKWFVNRIGQDVIKNGELSLISPAITILSESHARMLYISQTQNNHTYSEC